MQDSDIVTLFTYRFLIDEPQPPHNFTQDIADLQQFPERLSLSYIDEWKSDIKRYMSKNNLTIDDLEALSTQLTEPDTAQQYAPLKDIVVRALQINSSDTVSIIETPFKRYIDKLVNS